MIAAIINGTEAVKMFCFGNMMPTTAEAGPIPRGLMSRTLDLNNDC